MYKRQPQNITENEEDTRMDPNKRPEDMERITTPELAQAFIDEQVEAIRAQICLLYTSRCV